MTERRDGWYQVRVNESSWRVEFIRAGTSDPLYYTEIGGRIDMPDDEPTDPSPSAKELDRVNENLTDQQIKYLRDRFLNWTLPKDLSPDGGISFQRSESALKYNHPWPVGTNFLTATQAEEMVRHMVDGMPVHELAATGAPSATPTIVEPGGVASWRDLRWQGRSSATVNAALDYIDSLKRAATGAPGDALTGCADDQRWSAAEVNVMRNIVDRWRVGGKVPLNVYEYDRPMFQCHTPEAAARIVGLLNAATGAPSATGLEVACGLCSVCEEDDLRVFLFPCGHWACGGCYTDLACDNCVPADRKRATGAPGDAPAQRAEPGTPEAVVEALFAIAERECGHSRVSSQHALTTIELWITEAKRESAATKSERDGMRVTYRLSSAHNEHLSLRDHMLCRQIAHLQKLNGRKKRGIKRLREQLAALTTKWDAACVGAETMSRDLSSSIECELALQAENDELRSQLKQAQKRIYDAGMMLCCVNDIEQNPLEDLIKGNLQMLAGYHESEKRLREQLELTRADGARLDKLAFLVFTGTRQRLEIDADCDEGGLWEISIPDVGAETNHYGKNLREAIDSVRTQENTKPVREGEPE